MYSYIYALWPKRWRFSLLSTDFLFLSLHYTIWHTYCMRGNNSAFNWWITSMQLEWVTVCNVNLNQTNRFYLRLFGNKKVRPLWESSRNHFVLIPISFTSPPLILETQEFVYIKTIFTSKHSTYVRHTLSVAALDTTSTPTLYVKYVCTLHTLCEGQCVRPGGGYLRL